MRYKTFMADRQVFNFVRKLSHGQEGVVGEARVVEIDS